MIYLLPGMGADHRMYAASSWQTLPEACFLDWPEYQGEQTISAIADRVIAEARIREGDTLIGSSLGGYYATWLAERYGCRAALLNPAVLPADDLAGYVGEHTMYHSSEPFEWRAEYLHELQTLRIDEITRPERYLLLAATGDKVLDWRQMRDHYPGAQQHIIDASDHAISEFADYVELVADFCAGIGL